jgi:hypothetical protein
MKLKERQRYTVRYNNDHRQWEAVKDPTAKPYWENFWFAYVAAQRANNEDWKGFDKMVRRVRSRKSS